MMLKRIPKSVKRFSDKSREKPKIEHFQCFNINWKCPSLSFVLIMLETTY
jgi:hypothetical protein